MPDPNLPEGARLDVDPQAKELGERFRDAGFQCHLTKPVDPDELVEAIEQAACDAIPPLARNA